MSGGGLQADLNPYCPPNNLCFSPDGDATGSFPSNAGPFYEPFQLKNTTEGGKFVTFSCSGDGGIVCDSIRPSSATVDKGGAVTVVGWFRTGAPGTGHLFALAQSGASNDPAYYTIPVAP
jgi:hypothetical protein